MSMKNPLTPAEIEPATFRFVAQHLNHRATAVPGSDCIVIKATERCQRLPYFVLEESDYGSLVDRYSRNLVWTLFPLEDTQTPHHFNFSESLINRRPLSGEDGATPAPLVVCS